MVPSSKYEEAIKAKIEQLRNAPAEVEKLISNSARQIVLARQSNRFFDDAYVECFGAAALENKRFLNVGPGSFQHKYWSTADKQYGDAKSWSQIRRSTDGHSVDYYWDLYDRIPLAAEDASFEIIYSSHVIEHLYLEDVLFFFAESKRLLRAGGTLRLVCPDAALLACAYQRKDWHFFLHYLDVLTARLGKASFRLSEQERAEQSAAFVVEWVSCLTSEGHQPRLTPAECLEFLSKEPDIFSRFDEAGNLSSREFNRVHGGHVTWFSFEKLKTILQEVGFSDIRRSGYLQSKCPVLRDGRYFDKTDPEMSLFVEASA
jgi:SAM-dependent methyltransferase